MPIFNVSGVYNDEDSIDIIQDPVSFSFNVLTKTIIAMDLKKMIIEIEILDNASITTGWCWRERTTGKKTNSA